MSKVWCDRSLFQGIYYGLVTSEKMFFNELKRLKVKRKDWPDYRPTQSATTYTLQNEKGETVALVAIRNFEKEDPVEVAALLVHEATHIKQTVMEIIGENKPSNEFEAYMMQNIFGNLMHKFKAQTK